MFSKQAGLFDSLVADGLTPSAVKTLKSIFCNPQASLEHDGLISVTTEITSTDMRSARWAKCQYNWEYDRDPPSKGGHMAFVRAQECNDPTGVGSSGDLLKIYLPVSGSQDPNIESGETIMFFKTANGQYIAPGYGDNRIGSIIMGSQADKGIKGYALCNGTENAKGSSSGNGTGINLATKFPRCWSSPSDSGGTGGSATGALTLEGTFTANGIGNHSHTLSQTTIGTGSESTVSVVTGTPTGDSGVDLGTISVTFTGASGSGSPTAATIPPYTYVSFLERVDNSRNGIGD